MLYVQRAHHTHMFRQGAQIRTARQQLLNKKGPEQLKILSFGCSLGDEAATLRAYFPNAIIFGCDINQAVLQVAQRSAGELSKIFMSDASTIEQNGPYDLILASAVLCLNPVPHDLFEQFPFARFEEVLSVLDRNLNNGGILVITNASYRFSMSKFAKYYTTIRSNIVYSSGFIQVFDKESHPFLTPVASVGPHIYARDGSHMPLDDEDLADSVFQKGRTDHTDGFVTLLLDPIPGDAVKFASLTRENADYVYGDAPERMIRARFQYDFCKSLRNGEGYIFTVSWQSLVHDGWHMREPYWVPLP